MTEESFSNTSHLSATMTTEESDDVQTTATTTMSSSRGTDFYFACAVVVIRIVGAAGNGLILYAMIASKQHKKHFLIFNQNVFDLSSIKRCSSSAADTDQNHQDNDLCQRVLCRHVDTKRRLLPDGECQVKPDTA